MARISTWQEPGNHGGAFGLNVALATYGLIVLYCPVSFQRKTGKQYKRQGFAKHWLVEVSPEGIHSAIKGQADSRIEWAYFDSCAETDAMFVLIKRSTGTFISLPKTSLSAVEQDELPSIIAAHLPVTRA
jgi:hypothetical protein